MGKFSNMAQKKKIKKKSHLSVNILTQPLTCDDPYGIPVRKDHHPSHCLDFCPKTHFYTGLQKLRTHQTLMNLLNFYTRSWYSADFKRFFT